MAWSKDNQRLWWDLEQTLNQGGNTAHSERLSWELLNSSTIQNYQVQMKQPEVNSFRISYFSSVGSVNLQVN